MASKKNLHEDVKSGQVKIDNFLKEYDQNSYKTTQTVEQEE